MKKKVVAIIPIKKNSKRVKGKNFIKIKGKPLYRYLLDKLKKTHFDEIYIDTDSSEIRNYALKMGYQYIQRLPELSKDNANGNDLLNYHAKIIDADIYFQLFVTAPLLSIKSINKCISLLKKSKNSDNPYIMGRLDADLMYDIVMNWSWGNSQSPDIYHDVETRKNSISFRSNMARLAEKLIEEDKKEKAKNIIDLDRSPKEGDKVLFELRGSAEDKLQHAFNVKIIGSTNAHMR